MRMHWEPRRHPSCPAVSLPTRLTRRATCKVLYLFDRRDYGRRDLLPNRRLPMDLYRGSLTGTLTTLWRQEWLGGCHYYQNSPLKWLRVLGMTLSGWTSFTMAAVLRGGAPTICTREPTTSAAFSNVEIRSATAGSAYAGSTWDGSSTQQTATDPETRDGSVWHALVMDFGSRGHRLFIDGQLAASNAASYALQVTAQQLALGKRAGAVSDTVVAFFGLWQEQFGEIVAQEIMHSLPAALRAS